jgi:hypothetical protein
VENRFLEMNEYLGTIAGRRGPAYALRLPRTSPTRPRPASVSTIQSVTVATALAAQDRVLVILIENRGVDLGIPDLVDKLMSALPGSSLIPDSVRQQLIDFIREQIKAVTDSLLESAELSINRYASAKPDFFGDVIVLRDGTASYDDLKRTLLAQSRQGKVIDLLILTHGANDAIDVNGGINGQKIRDIRAEFGAALTIRSVYMMNCVGSSLNQAWLDAGARASAGTIRNNYLPEPTTFFFWTSWKEGRSFEESVTSAYRKTINLMNDAVRGFIRQLPIPGSGAVADAINFENMDFVRDSAPVVQGQRRITIASDDLSATQSIASSLATTVLSVSTLRSVAAARGIQTLSAVKSYEFHSPSVVMRKPTDVSRMQNPAAAVIAGMEIGDALQVGLGAVAVVQAQVSASQGSFAMTFDRAQRLLTSEARAQMPGAQVAKTKYSRRLLYIGASRLNAAEADIVIDWEGNPYGEIGTPNIRRNLGTSTEWSKSSATITIARLETIPLPQTDPRTWPIVYSIEGTYDPWGNGYFEFSSEFEINAFGGLKFSRHQVVSRAAVEFAVMGQPEEYVQKGVDAIVPVPSIPDDQVAYLRTRLP